MRWVNLIFAAVVANDLECGGLPFDRSGGRITMTAGGQALLPRGEVEDHLRGDIGSSAWCSCENCRPAGGDRQTVSGLMETRRGDPQGPLGAAARRLEDPQLG
jgi:hypothetical protein